MAFVLVFGVLPVLAVAYFTKSEPLDNFLSQQSLGLIGIMLAIYISTASSFVVILTGFEEKGGMQIFQKTSEELRENILFVFFLFFAHFLLLVAGGGQENIALEWLLRGAKVFTFLLFIFALYELSGQLFTVRRKLFDIYNSEKSE